MSGGVDSTVSAYLLKKEGHEVIGVNFAFVGAGPHATVGVHATIGVHATVGASYASPLNKELTEISEKLNIKIIYKDYRSEFQNKIIKSFVDNYEHGITPNPCAICNPTMKFEKLLEVMREENCDMIATGHYANIALVGASYASPNRYCIKKSLNQQKDQSYMLYRLTQDQLSHIIFPLSDMDKNDVRKIATELGLKVANQKDSQDICFINAGASPTIGTNATVGANACGAHVGASYARPLDYKEFIKRYEFGTDYREKIARGILKEDEILSRPYFKKGEFVDLDGKVLGYHNGIINYTIGQRKGLNIAFGERKFVVRIDASKNQIVLGDNDDLMSSDFKIRDVVFSGHDEDVIGKKFYAKLRYRHDGTPCEVVGANATVGANACGARVLTCHLSSPVRAITPGQSAVFYHEDGRVMFGGILI